jgi:hypothetical protein
MQITATSILVVASAASTFAALSCNPSKSVCVDAVKSGSNLKMRVETTNLMGWVGIGFGTKMQGADLILMSKDGAGKAKIVNARGRDGSIADATNYISEPEVKTEGGKLVYTFVRPVNDLKTGAPMIWAVGNTMTTTSHSDEGSNMKLDITEQQAPAPAPPTPSPSPPAPNGYQAPTQSVKNEYASPSPAPGYGQAQSSYGNGQFKPAESKPIYCRRRMPKLSYGDVKDTGDAPTKPCKDAKPADASPSYGGVKSSYGETKPSYGEAKPAGYGEVKPANNGYGEVKPANSSYGQLQQEYSDPGYGKADGFYGAAPAPAYGTVMNVYDSPTPVTNYGPAVTSSVKNEVAGPTTTSTPCTSTPKPTPDYA